MLRSSNCVLTGKTPMEFAKLNECPLDPGTQTKTEKNIYIHQFIVTILICMYNIYFTSQGDIL